MICPHCGDNIHDGYEVCPSCGGGLYDQYQYDQPGYQEPPPADYPYDEQAGYGDPAQADYPYDGQPGYEEQPPADYPYDEQVYEEGPYPEGGEAFPPAEGEPFPDEEFASSGFSQKTSIVALDPEFQKGTRIVANPMLDSSSRKRARVRAGSPTAEDIPKDEMGRLIYDFKYAFGRMNILEKVSVMLFAVIIFMSFAPWVKVVQYNSWVSGYETIGIWVAISSLISGVVLLLKIGMRLPIWATMVHILTAFSAASVPLYLVIRKPLEGQAWMLPFYLVLGLTCAAFGTSFFGAMRRFLK